MKMFTILVFITIYTSINVQGFEPAKKTITTIWMVTFTDCKGKDAGNYSNTLAFGSDALCSQNSMVLNGKGWVAHTEKGDKYFATSPLATSTYPAGPDVVYEVLTLVTSGPLQGKYLMMRGIQVLNDYLKLCSSVLGQSYITTKRAELLISDNLSPEVLVNPNGPYEAFKKGCTTACNGQYVGVKF